VEIVTDDEDGAPTYAVTNQHTQAAGRHPGKALDLLADREAIQFIKLSSKQAANCLAVAGNNSLAVAGQGKALLILDLVKFRQRGAFESQGNVVTSVALSPVATWALSGDEDGGLLLWDAESEIGRA